MVAGGELDKPGSLAYASALRLWWRGEIFGAYDVGRRRGVPGDLTGGLVEWGERLAGEAGHGRLGGRRVAVLQEVFTAHATP